jgi:methyl-accepting chemotaxis protein
LDAIIANAPKAIEAILTLISSVISGLIMRIPYFVTTLLGIIGDILIALGKNIGKIANGVIDIIVAIFDAVGERAYELVTSFVDMVAAILDAVASNMYTIVETGCNLVLSWIEAINKWLENSENRERLKLDLIEFIALVLELLGEIIGAFVKIGWDIVLNICKGIGDFASTLAGKIKNAVQDAINGIKEFFEDAKEIGKNIILGIIKGIKDKIEDLKNAAEDIVDSLGGTIKKLLHINSPSKEMMKIGEYVDEGLVIGMENGEDDVSKQAENLANSMLDPINGINDNIEQPTVKPVMDLSDFNYDQDQLDNMSASMSKDLKTKFDFSPTTTSSLAFNMPEINADSNLVADAVDSLKDQFGELKEYISKIGIRMDSGALVGSIVGKMDKELGNLSTLKGRFM